MIKKLFMLLLFAFGVGAAIPSTRAQMLDAVKPVADNLRARLVPRRLEVMADQLDVRLQRAEGFPNKWDSWLRRDYSGVQDDPWGNIYYLKPGRRSYTVGSNGPDGQIGTPDDITVTRNLPGGR